MRENPKWKTSPSQKQEEVQVHAKSRRACHRSSGSVPSSRVAKSGAEISHGDPVPWATTMPNSVILFFVN